jgi:hypothetical protein
MEWNLHGCFNFKKALMKKYIFFLLIGTTAFAACKSKKNTASSSANTSTTTTTSSSSTSGGTASISAVPAGTTTGKVSHQYRSTGCATVIVFIKDGTEMTLIPKDKLPAEYDVDGLQINFNYHPLKMANPAGCATGMPAEITDLSKK